VGAAHHPGSAAPLDVDFWRPGRVTLAQKLSTFSSPTVRHRRASAKRDRPDRAAMARFQSMSGVADAGSRPVDSGEVNSCLHHLAKRPAVHPAARPRASEHCFCAGALCIYVRRPRVLGTGKEVTNLHEVVDVGSSSSLGDPVRSCERASIMSRIRAILQSRAAHQLCSFEIGVEHVALGSPINSRTLHEHRMRQLKLRY